MADYNVTYFKPSTDSIPIFNDNLMLKISYYDTSMRFEIRMRNMDGHFPTPDKDKEISVFLSAENVAKLSVMLDVFDKKLDEYNADFAAGKDCTGYKPYSISVYTGTTPDKTRVFTLSTGTVTEQGFVPEVIISIGVNENKVANNSYVFKTKATPVLIDYEGDTGKFDMQLILGQYIIVAAAIKNFMIACTKAFAHFNKNVVNDEKLNSTENLIKLIADHHNISLPEKGRGYNGYNNDNSVFGSFNSNNTQPPVIDGGDIGTLLGSPNVR
jgi:hypothetical protein